MYFSLYICGTINSISRHPLDANPTLIGRAISGNTTRIERSNGGHIEGTAIASGLLFLVTPTWDAVLSMNIDYEWAKSLRKIYVIFIIGPTL